MGSHVTCFFSCMPFLSATYLRNYPSITFEIYQAMLNEFNKIHEQITFCVYAYLTSNNLFMFTINKQFHSFQCVWDKIRSYTFMGIVFRYPVSDKVKVRNYGANHITFWITADILQFCAGSKIKTKRLRNYIYMYKCVYTSIKFHVTQNASPPHKKCRGHIYMHKQTCFAENKQINQNWFMNVSRWP